MNEKTKVVSIVMRGFICNSSYHEPFFSRPLTDITEACLTFLIIRSSTKSTSMTSFIYFLTTFVYSHRTLWTFLNRIAHFREITEAR